MRWYINDASLQGQFTNVEEFEKLLGELSAARQRNEPLRYNLRTSREISSRYVMPSVTLRSIVQRSTNREFRNAILAWLQASGPFVDDDRLAEPDDYFEYAGLEVTDSGLGEAARRTKAGEQVATFSFAGGTREFSISPLIVHHGIEEDRLGRDAVTNVWSVSDLLDSARAEEAPLSTWPELIRASRIRYERLLIPDSVFERAALRREPFDAVIRDRALALLGYLNAYMLGRQANGSEGERARAIIEMCFQGDRALFVPESRTNQQEYQNALTFPDPENPENTVFAHWHGRISRRFFRLHFEWPVPAEAESLKIVYLGPKITKG